MKEADRRAMFQQMYGETRELMGTGYVPEYYQQITEGFSQIAEYFVDEAVKDALKADRFDRRDRPANIRYRFTGRNGNRLVWESTTQVDGRTERLTIAADAFWSPKRSGR